MIQRGYDNSSSRYDLITATPRNKSTILTLHKNKGMRKLNIPPLKESDNTIRNIQYKPLTLRICLNMDKDGGKGKKGVLK